jgi:hypothetical protein
MHFLKPLQYFTKVIGPIECFFLFFLLHIFSTLAVCSCCIEWTPNADLQFLQAQLVDRVHDGGEGKLNNEPLCSASGYNCSENSCDIGLWIVPASLLTNSKALLVLFSTDMFVFFITKCPSCQERSVKPSLRKLQSIRRRLSGCAAEFCTSPPASPAYIVPASQSRQPDSGQSMSIDVNRIRGAISVPWSLGGPRTAWQKAISWWRLRVAWPGN